MLLLLACQPDLPAQEDTGALPTVPNVESDADSAGDTAEDTDGEDDPWPWETGFVRYVTAELTVVDDRLLEATYGYELRAGDVVACSAEGWMPYEGPAPGGCPGCTWAFDTAPLEESYALGAYCGDFGLEEGSLDGWGGYAWGFAPTYTYWYGDTAFVLEDVVFLYTDAWFAFAFDYAGREWVDVDGATTRILRPLGPEQHRY